MKNDEFYASTDLQITVVVSAKTEEKMICVKPTLMQDSQKFNKLGSASTQNPTCRLTSDYKYLGQFRTRGQTFVIYRSDSRRGNARIILIVITSSDQQGHTHTTIDVGAPESLSLWSDQHLSLIHIFLITLAFVLGPTPPSKANLIIYS